VTSKLKIALIEAQDLGKNRSYEPVPTEFSNRCSSVTPATVKYLRGKKQNVLAQ
jgi:ubiquinone biosynthesis monooxygenase Coq6